MSVEKDIRERTLKRRTSARYSLTFGMWLIIAYGALLLATDLFVPLRVSEILQILAAWRFNWDKFLAWIVQTPGSAPLTYFVQLPLLLIWPHGRLAARFATLIFGIACCFLFLSLAKRFSLKRPELALVLFMFVPIHFRIASEAAPFEVALFFSLAATLSLLDLLKTPGIRGSILYGAFLTLALYTEPYSFLPAIGYLLFLLRFVNRAHERRVIWFALPATVFPAALFFPYYAWAHPQASSSWLSAPASPAGVSQTIQLFGSLVDSTRMEWLPWLLFFLLAAGGIAGVWSTFRAVYPLAKRINLFCLAGGIITTIAIDLIAGAIHQRFDGVEIVWAVPAFIVLFFAGVEWLFGSNALAMGSVIAASLVLAISISFDADYLFASKEDLQSEADAVLPQLKGDSCLVFVSQGLSRQFFLLFKPELGAYECHDFFHHRIVMASHPYVRMDQQEDAEAFFRGLGFQEKIRLNLGGGRIVVDEQP